MKPRRQELADVQLQAGSVTKSRRRDERCHDTREQRQQKCHHLHASPGACWTAETKMVRREEENLRRSGHRGVNNQEGFSQKDALSFNFAFKCLPAFYAEQHLSCLF